MKTILGELTKAREKELIHYSPYIFIREIKEADQLNDFVLPELEKYGAGEPFYQELITVEGEHFIFLYEYQSWDSNFFGRPFYKLFTVLFAGKNAISLIKAITLFKEKLGKIDRSYCVAEIPAEDIFLMQCLTAAGVKLVETRLHFHKKKLEGFQGPRFSVRRATEADSEYIARTAADSRNYYDRFHADFLFSDQEADNYLAAYAKAAVNGFCDYVLVPDYGNRPASSFMAFDHIENLSPRHKLNLLWGRISAVAPENKGWYIKLFYEMVHFAKEKGCDYMSVVTQSTNKVVLRTFEKTGCSYSATTHILSFSARS